MNYLTSRKYLLMSRLTSDTSYQICNQQPFFFFIIIIKGKQILKQYGYLKSDTVVNANTNESFPVKFTDLFTGHKVWSKSLTDTTSTQYVFAKSTTLAIEALMKTH